MIVQRRRAVAFLALAVAMALPCIRAKAIAQDPVNADIVVFGATGAGVVAAIAASRSGAANVVLLSANRHVGGMLTGGLQHTDSANDSVVQGITREFFVRVEKQYPGRPTDAKYPKGHSPPGWLFESHVAERVVNEMLGEANVTVVRNVIGVERVERDQSVVTRLDTVDGSSFAAPIFIDCSYEGDLLALGGATMTWGRESTAQYGEPDAGRRDGAYRGSKINPYWNASAGNLEVLPHVEAAVPALPGEADSWIEPYDFRLCFTNSPGNRLAFTRPDSYNASEWEYWRRVYKANPPKTLGDAGLGSLGPIPNNYSDCGSTPCKKFDMLGMVHGTDMTNGAWRYPNASLDERAAIWRTHIEYTRGLLWFWLTDDAVPKSVSDELSQYGHCTDEYDADSDPPHWPHQLYVREARRLVGDFVWTENPINDTMRSRSVGLGSYLFDCHTVSRVIHREGGPTEHYVVEEGRVNVGRNPKGVTQTPFTMPYDSMLPRLSELTNVFGPVALSASHVRFNAIRMEPTWMILGHAAGTAAAMLVAEGPGAPPVQALDVGKLQERLLAQGQLLYP